MYVQKFIFLYTVYATVTITFKAYSPVELLQNCKTNGKMKIANHHSNMNFKNGLIEWINSLELKYKFKILKVHITPLYKKRGCKKHISNIIHPQLIFHPFTY